MDPSSTLKIYLFYFTLNFNLKKRVKTGHRSEAMDHYGKRRTDKIQNQTYRKMYLKNQPNKYTDEITDRLEEERNSAIYTTKLFVDFNRQHQS